MKYKFNGLTAFFIVLSISLQLQAVEKIENLDAKVVKKVKKRKKLKSIKDQHKTGLLFLGETVGLGYDSNPYVTPSDTYVDYSVAATPTITPKVESGFFVPLHLDVYYGQKIKKNFYYGLNANIKGRFFVDSSLQNANNHHTVVSVDSTYYNARYKSRKSGLKASLFFINHYEIYVDHDNGEFKNTQFDGTGTDIENRYQYTSNGVDLNYFTTHRKWELWSKLHYEVLDYETPAKWSQLDHNYYYASLKGKRKFNKKSKGTLEYRYSVRDYDVRPSYSFTATNIRLSIKNGALHYTFHDLKSRLDRVLNKKTSLTVNYDYQQRIDATQGYNNSQSHKIKVTGKYKWNKKLSQVLFVQWSERTYENAHAYDETPQFEAKYYQKDDFGTTFNYKASKHMTLKAGMKLEDQFSSDKRYDYERMTTFVTLMKNF